MMNFSEEAMYKADMSIASGPFHIPDPVAPFSLINAISYFAGYPERCNSLDGIDPEAVRETTISFYEDMFSSLPVNSSVTFCLKGVPFWKTE